MARRKGDPARDSESRTGEIVAILSIASALSTLAVLLRCYCRHILLRSFGWDDAVMVVAQVLTIASAVAIGLETQWGLGRHVWTMSKEHFTPYMKAFYSSIIVYNVAVWLTKTSILLQYRRIFFQAIHRKIILGFLLALGAWGVALCIMLPLVCRPVESFWNPAVPGHCLNFETVWYIMAGVNVVTDIVLFIMPIPVIRSLQLPTRQKLLLLFVFGVGVFPCAISIYRITTLHAAAVATDPTWDNVGAATFSFLELTIGVVAVCLPTLRPLLAIAMPRLLSSLRSQKHSNSAGLEDDRSRQCRGNFSIGTASSTLRGSGLEGDGEDKEEQSVVNTQASEMRQDPECGTSSLRSGQPGHERAR